MNLTRGRPLQLLLCWLSEKLARLVQALNLKLKSGNHTVIH
jgi:hypothetical protein